MIIKERKARVRRFFDRVVGEGDLAAVDELLGAGCTYRDAGRLSTTGRGEFANYLVAARSPFDQIHVEIQDIIAEGDRVAVRCTYHLTVAGEHSTAAVMAVFRFDQAKIVEMWRTVAAQE